MNSYSNSNYSYGDRPSLPPCPNCGNSRVSKCPFSGLMRCIGSIGCDLYYGEPNESWKKHLEKINSDSCNSGNRSSFSNSYSNSNYSYEDRPSNSGNGILVQGHYKGPGPTRTYNSGDAKSRYQARKEYKQAHTVAKNASQNGDYELEYIRRQDANDAWKDAGNRPDGGHYGAVNYARTAYRKGMYNSMKAECGPGSTTILDPSVALWLANDKAAPPFVVQPLRDYAARHYKW